MKKEKAYHLTKKGNFKIKKVTEMIYPRIFQEEKEKIVSKYQISLELKIKELKERQSELKTMNNNLEKRISVIKN